MSHGIPRFPRWWIIATIPLVLILFGLICFAGLGWLRSARTKLAIEQEIEHQRLQADLRLRQEKNDAARACRYFILDALKHPHDVTFPDAERQIFEDRGDGMYNVRGLVRAPNDFGVAFTHDWGCLVRLADDRETWECLLLLYDHKITKPKHVRVKASWASEK